jgi:flavodoxin
MKIFTIMLVLTAVFWMTESMGNAAENQSAGKILVAYFSWSGNTRGIAREIHQKTGGDIFEIELVKPYSKDYNTVLDEAQRDQRAGARPELKTHVQNMEQYDVVFIGYPNWWASIPMPIASFLEEYDFSGKKIVPFCSHGGGRLGQSVSAITKLCSQSTILEALSSGGSSLGSDIDAWLSKIGIKAK